MYNHNKAQQSQNRVHISWDILYAALGRDVQTYVRYLSFEAWELCDVKLYLSTRYYWTKWVNIWCRYMCF